MADEDGNFFITDADIARQYAFNPLAAAGDDFEDVVIYIDLPMPDDDDGGGGGGGGGGDDDDDDDGSCGTILSGEVTLYDLPANSVAVTSNSVDLTSGPERWVIRDGGGPWSMDMGCDSGERALLGYLDGDDNGYFEPSDPIGVADANPILLGIGNVPGIQTDIPAQEEVTVPTPPAYVPITGTVIYDAFTTGDVIVRASHVSTDGYVFSGATLAAPGAFSLIAPADTDDVLVWAVLDSDGDGLFDTALDPFDFHGPANTELGITGLVLDLGDAPLGSIGGTITWEGPVAAGDVLHVALLDTPVYDPSMGPPEDFIEVVNPGFPFGYLFDEVPSGTWYVGSYLDIDGDDPSGAGEGDPEFQTSPLLLAPGDNVTGWNLALQE